VQLTVRPGHGLTARTADDRFSLNLRGRVQVRDALTIPGGGGDAGNELSIRRMRLTLGGHVFSRDIQYSVQLGLSNQDMESDSRVPLLDAYVTLTHLRDLNVRAGQFLVPFGRAKVISSGSAQLVDRAAMVSELNLDRDVGVQLFSNDLFGLGHRLGYQVGIFGGEGRNRLPVGRQSTGLLYVARVQVNPFGKFDDYVEGDLTRSMQPRLSIGLGGAYNQNTARDRSTSGHVLTLGGFDYAHAAADVMFKMAGFSFFGEALYRQVVGEATHTSMPMGGATPLTERSRSAWGYFLQAGYMLTEQLEVAGRWSQLLPLDVQGNEPKLVALNEAGGGLSWYLHGHALKVQGDYFYLFNDPATPGRHQVRLQLQASF
jgi:hypothetical protein